SVNSQTLSETRGPPDDWAALLSISHGVAVMPARFRLRQPQTCSRKKKLINPGITKGKLST
ncbi:MAG: hypothetical protein ACYSWO_17825, partial [Planctomycetota bacterium]